MAILISNKTDCNAKYITRDKKRHFIMINLLTHQEDITIINVYTANKRKQNLTVMRGEIDHSTITAGDFNNLLSTTGRTSRPKISNGSQHLNKTINQFDLIVENSIQ